MPSNLLVVILDDLGIEKLKTYGFDSGIAPTPRFDALVDQGVLFTRAYAGPICGPTRSAIQTGRYAFRTGFGTNMMATDASPAYRLPKREVILPEMLNAGRPGTYACAAFGKWHLTYFVGDDLHPNDCGYPHFSGCMANTAAAGNGSGQFDWRRVIDGVSTFVTGPPFDRTQWQASVTVDDALAWIAAQTGPWLAYVAMNPPHGPFGPPPFEFLSAATIAALEKAGLAPGDTLQGNEPLERRVLCYDAMIEAVDQVLHELVQGAATPDTLVVIIGDNGTPGDAILPPFQAQHAKRTIYEQGVRVPMLVLGAGVNSPGRASSALVHAADIFRTLGEMSGATFDPTWPKSDSVSFQPILHDPMIPSVRTSVFTESFRPNGTGTHTFTQRTMIGERYKYLRFDSHEEFYDLPNDPRELNDLVVAGMSPAEELEFELLSAEMDALLAS